MKYKITLLFISKAEPWEIKEVTSILLGGPRASSSINIYIYIHTHRRPQGLLIYIYIYVEYIDMR